jgi:RNA polymerase sigma factor (TIGR02999 family)
VLPVLSLCLRLVGDQHFEGRGHFFEAAETMRRIVVNHARDRNRLRLGGGRHRVDLDGRTGSAVERNDDRVELDAARDRLSTDYPAVADLVKLRFFAGMTLGEAADFTGLPRRTADRHCGFAPAWLADTSVDVTYARNVRSNHQTICTN